jgi:hypothetical protein
MTCAEKRVVDDVCETAVNGAPLVAQVAVEDGRQERVREADHPALAQNYPARRRPAPARLPLSLVGSRITPVWALRPSTPLMPGVPAGPWGAQWANGASRPLWTGGARVAFRPLRAGRTGRVIISHSFPSVLLNRKA